MKNIFNTLYSMMLRNLYSWLYRSFLFDWLIKIFKKTAIEGCGSDRCLEKGFLPVPANYFSPIPDLKDLEKRRVWDKKSEMNGIDFNLKNQLILLDKLGQKYGPECNWPLRATTNPADYFVDNKSFVFGCAATSHTIIREFKPSKVIEIGSGYSSIIISNALDLNRKEDGKNAEYIIIDPFPLPVVSRKLIHYNKLIKKRIELIDPKFFDQLDENDILFIDSGHSVRIGGDINFLYLEVLPRLRPGVIIHCHDIDMPYEYPKFYATNKAFRQFWTERYLLQAFLIYNKQFEILLATTYLMRNHMAKFKKLFPSYNPRIPEGRHAISPSFWMRRTSKS